VPSACSRDRPAQSARRGAFRTTLLETYSTQSGRIRVEERGPERRLLVGGEIQSVYPTDGDWSRLRHEYWARGLPPSLPARSRVLFVGLGGATQVHLLRRHSRPRLITVIERDATVIRIAQEWFGLQAIGGLEILCTDADCALRQLAAARRRFEFIMDDISYAAPIATALGTAEALARLLAPGGRLVLNQHSRADARAVAMALGTTLGRVRLRWVRQETENILIIAERRARAGRSKVGTIDRR
jgi:spermidine synthase